MGTPAGGRRGTTDLEERAHELGIPVTHPDSMTSPAFLDALARFRPDLIIVATFPDKLPDRVLGGARLGGVNLHSSLLPAYRGPIPEFWALRNGDDETGVTLHVMTAVYDAGPILDAARVPISPRDDLVTLSRRLGDSASRLALRWVDELAGHRGSLSDLATPQDDARVTYAPIPGHDELRIDWGEPALSIERLVRATRPVFEAFTRHGDRRIIVRAVEVAPPGTRLAPGRLEIGRAGELLVGAGDGTAVVVNELEVDGVTLCAPALGESSVFALDSGDQLG